MLCSDGLTNFVEDDEIRTYIKNKSNLQKSAGRTCSTCKMNEAAEIILPLWLWKGRNVIMNSDNLVGITLGNRYDMLEKKSVRAVWLQFIRRKIRF